MNFEESIDWLYSFKKYGSKLGLNRVIYLMKQLKDPQNVIKTIHVTGTNGKGSVCKYLESILQNAGYTVGVYISPHLQRFSERISINGIEISKRDIAALIGEIKPVVDEMIGNDDSPTFFEIVTAMAFLHFSNSDVDYAVIEVGLGGRFDATNVIIPEVSVITNISIEHSKQLGEDVKSIAFEKAGVIKENISVVTAAKGDAKFVIENVAKEKNAHMIYVDCNSWKRMSHSLRNQTFAVQGVFCEYIVKTSLLGEYQGENISLAIATIEQLQSKGLYLSNDCIEKGISEAFNPGRMEIVSEKPMILLDGAHNPAGMKMLSQSLKKDFTYDRFILVLGILEDKNIENMLSEIIPLSDTVIVTKSNSIRACNPKDIKEKIEKQGYKKDVIVFDSIPESIQYAESIATLKDLVCVSGSLFTIGEARGYFFDSKESC